MIVVAIIIGIIVIIALAGGFKPYECEICKKVLSAKEEPLRGELDGIAYKCLCRRCFDRVEDAISSAAFSKVHGHGISKTAKTEERRWHP